MTTTAAAVMSAQLELSQRLWLVVILCIGVFEWCHPCFHLFGGRSLPTLWRRSGDRMNLTIYAQRLAAAVASRKKSAFDDLCFDLEGEQLTREHWQPEVFALVLEALRDPVICGLSGARSFVLSLYNDFEKLTVEQRASLLEAFDAEADNFGDEMLRHSVSDLIARKYSSQEALRVFIQWANAGSPNRRHMALVGLDVLIMASRLNARDQVKAQSLLADLNHA